MKTHICCKNCGSIFLGESSWRGAFIICPYCHQTTYFSFDDKCQNSNVNFLWMFWGGFLLAFILFICIIGFGICAITINQTNTYSANTYPNSSLSIQGLIAKDFIETELPNSQRNALMGIGGTFDDKANAISNLINSDNLSGAIEYLNRE